jgi:hypothetical protein
MFRATSCMLVFLAVLALAVSAQAVSITVDGVTQFDANGFESDAVGSAPSVTTPAGSSWWSATHFPSTLNTQDGTVAVQLGGGSNPAAQYGNNLLSMYKPVPGPNNTDSPCAYSEAKLPSAVNTVGSNVTASFGLYIPTAGSLGGDGGVPVMADFMGSDFDPNGTLSPYKSNYNHTGWLNQADAVTFGVSTAGVPANNLLLVEHDGSAWGNVKTAGGQNMSMSPDAWHNVTLSATLGSTYTLSIDGTTSAALAPDLKSPDIGGLMFMTNDSNVVQFYVDGHGQATPEPSTCILASLGLIGLLAYAWRKRR